MATINVGDLVRITDVDHSYTQFSAMFRQMGFRNDAERDNPYSNGDVLQVFSVQDHPTNSNYILYGLQHPTNRMSTQVLMNHRGIKYVLPGNWHIKVTPENNEMLGNWRESGSIDGMEGIVLSEYHGSRGYWLPDNGRIPDHCQIEITTEQFVQYVLNQTPTDMPQELTPEQEYQAASDAMNLQPGDVVRVTQRWRSNARGWNNHWTDNMDIHIGNEYPVISVAGSNAGVRLHTVHFSFPIYSLELVRRANEVAPTPEPTTNLENEQEDAVVTTTEKVICITDKWNYVNLGEVYEVIKRDEYYTYVKDSVGGESRYAHLYFEEWVDADTKARRDSFKALFGDHSKTMFKNASDDVQKLLAELYPKLYEYRGWLNFKKNSDHESEYLFNRTSIKLIDDSSTSNTRLHGAIQFDPSDYSMEMFYHNGYNYIRFRHR